MEQNTLQYFADYLKESEHSPATIEKYLRDLRHFLTFASVDKGIHNKTTKYGLPTY